MILVDLTDERIPKENASELGNCLKKCLTEELSSESSNDIISIVRVRIMENS
jgi:hypothetical protein